MANKSADRNSSRKGNGKKEKGTNKKSSKEMTDYQRERLAYASAPKRNKHKH